MGQWSQVWSALRNPSMTSGATASTWPVEWRPPECWAKYRCVIKVRGTSFILGRCADVGFSTGYRGDKSNLILPRVHMLVSRYHQCEGQRGAEDLLCSHGDDTISVTRDRDALMSELDEHWDSRMWKRHRALRVKSIPRSQQSNG